MAIMLQYCCIMINQMSEITLSGITINDSTPPFIIAEVGHNHQGNLQTALALIRAAADSGASAVKFQKRNNKQLFIPSTYNELYNSENAFGTTYGLHREFLEFGKENYEKCVEEANKLGITFFATAFDFESADFLNSLNLNIYKIASSDLRNLPLLEYVAKFRKPIIISTGGANFGNVDLAVQTVRKYHNQLAILQCTASYPADFAQLNLRVIAKLRELYPENVIGYSGHENGISMPVVAYTLGARIIEKHFTLNRTMRGTDHAFSLEPQGMKKMVRDLHRAAEAMGDGIKKVYDSELAPLKKMGKSIVAAKNLSVGHIIEIRDLEFRSPAIGISPDCLDQVIGKTCIEEFMQYEPIQHNKLR